MRLGESGLAYDAISECYVRTNYSGFGPTPLQGCRRAGRARQTVLEYSAALCGAITASDRKSMSADRIRTAQPSRRRPLCQSTLDMPAASARAFLSGSSARRCPTPPRGQRDLRRAQTPASSRHSRSRCPVPARQGAARRRRALHYYATCLTSRTCLQLPRQRKPSQVHSRWPVRPKVTR
jgi:hypothetical protein